MKKRKDYVKRFAAVASSMIVLILMVAPLSVSAAGEIVEVLSAYGYWTKYKPSFEYSEDVTFQFADILSDTPIYGSVNPLFSRNIPDSLKTETFRQGYYDGYGVYLYGYQSDVEFSMQMSFHLRLTYFDCPRADFYELT